MQSDSIGNYRIAGQRINAGKFAKAAEIVAHLGAMQAQDFPMARLAVGLRSVSLTEADVLDAYNKGEILRTHVLRPTWHLITSEDADWMLRLTAPRLLAAMSSWSKKLKLTKEVYARSNRILASATAKKPVTRDEAVATLKKAKPGFPPGSHTLLLFRAEVDRVIISGPIVDGETTYALFTDRVKKHKILRHDEALARLAHRYFTGHGPATLDDFTWWSGLKVGDARTAYAAVEKQFSRETIGETRYLIPKGARPAADKVYLLPAFDEFIIGYSDRSAVLAASISSKVVSNNGIFRATIVANGIVRGIWKREIKKGKLAFKPEYFGKADAGLKEAVAERAQELAAFWGTV